ncbi:MAG: sugar-binding protein [Planctomycetota bacterium]
MLAKKCLFVGIVTLLSFSLAMADPPKHPKTGEPLILDCLRGTPDAIDGDLSDWNLGAMTPAVLDMEEQLYMGQTTWDNPEDSSGEFYLLWDDENIYMAVVMKDEKLSQNKTGGSIWNADAIEIFFSTLNAVGGHDEHYQYGFDFKEQTWNWCNMDSGGQSAIDYLQVASTVTADGYILEASIEYGQMLSLDFSAGNTIGFHPVFDDTDNGDRELQMTWTGREAHDQSQGFGYLFLSDAAVAPGFSSGPSPAKGAMIEDIWVNLSWRAGEFAVSHDVYLGDNFDDVDAGAEGTFVGNQAGTFIVVGFPGFPYPDGLVPGTTYYWRIDEVNDTEPNSPWKGDVWSFSIPPKTAYNPNPADGAEFVATDATLSWTPGFGAKLHTVYIGTDFDNVNNAAGGAPQGLATYKPASLELEKVYYWRVDEFDAIETYKGDVWSFTTPGAVGNPQPANGAADVQMTATLSWTPADNAASHELYFGTDRDAVNNATTASPEYVGPRALGSESYDPGKLGLNAVYHWRVDEVYPTETIKGLVWSFTTADFLLVDDFESYNDIDPPDPASNRIFEAWIDGYGTTDNGALVGNEMPPYAEQSIVHGGAQSMPYFYDNNLKTSEATLMLVSRRDWTEEGVTKLSLWFSGASGNSAERMFVALGNAVVYHDDPAVTQTTGWNEWVIDLQAFAGVDLTNVNSITIGFGTKNSPAAGGAGTMYLDDIRLVR